MGTDSLQLFLVSTELAAEAEVVWAPGPDLIVSHFSPPYVRSQGGNPVYIAEITQNVGARDSGSSTTRYYVAPRVPFDPASARVIGERRVGPLLSGKEAGRGMTRFTLPGDLTFGVFYFAACADVEHEIVETDETNNCVFSYVEDESGSRVIIERGGGVTPRSGF